MNIVRSISLSLLLSAAPYLARAQDVVAGTSVVGGSQRPLPGAQVSIEGQTGKGATADANGRFRVTGVTGTQVTLNVRYEEAQLILAEAQGRTAAVTIINALRATQSLKPYTGATDAAYGNTVCLPLPDIERVNNPNVGT